MRYATGFVSSLIVLAIGAVLDFAITVQTNGVNWNTVGVILMAVGAIGVVCSLAIAASANSSRTYRRQRRVSQDAAGTFVDERGTY